MRSLLPEKIRPPASEKKAIRHAGEMKKVLETGKKYLPVKQHVGLQSTS